MGPPPMNLGDPMKALTSKYQQSNKISEVEDEQRESGLSRKPAVRGTKEQEELDRDIKEFLRENQIKMQWVALPAKATQSAGINNDNEQRKVWPKPMGNLG